MLRIKSLLIVGICAFSLSSGQDLYDRFPNFKGWSVEHNYEVFHPENLWDYINGAADAYLGYNFMDLHIAEYRKGKNLVKVEIYRHESPSDAFGIYSMERSPDLNFIEMGAQGYEMGDILNFFCFQYYVKMFGQGKPGKLLPVMKEIGVQVAAALGSNPGFPGMLEVFPSEGKLPHTEGYAARNFLGQEFFSRTYTCKYQDGGEFQLFVHRAESPEECRNLLAAYLDFTRQDPEMLKEGQLLLKDPYNGDIYLYWQGQTLAGVQGASSPGIAVKYLDMLRSNLFE